MHQDATWYGGRPQPRGLCVRWGPSPLPKSRWSPGAEPPIFGPCLFWPNSWMHQDATWYGDFVLDGDQATTQKGQNPTQFLVHVYCGQKAAWIKMQLGTEVGQVDLGLRNIVFDVDPATPRKRAQPPPPNFGPCLLWPNSWMDEDAA